MAQTLDQEVTVTQELRKPSQGALDSDEQPASIHEDLIRKRPRTKWSRWLVLFVFGLVLTAGTLWWLHSRNYESTDDAQVDGHLDVVSTRINGTVTYVNPRVENNQFVTEGTLLLELDPRDYEAELEHAKANLATATADEH